MSAAVPIAIKQGDVVYARLAGNKSHGWYVIDDVRDEYFGAFPAVRCHREHGAGQQRETLLMDVQKVENGMDRWNR